MADTMLNSALSYAEQGFKVMALKPRNKVPQTEHGLKDATQLQVTIKDLWTRWPDANIGIVTDGYVVLDFDADHGGLESKWSLVSKYGEFLPTRVHKTGGGGEHWIYRQHNGQSIRNTVKVAGYNGVDLRGTGGYIVAPPSIHPNGNEYLVLDPSPIAPCPDWIPQLIQTVGRLSQKPMAPGASIPQSTRNDTMIRNAGAMRRRGMTEEEILAALLVQNKRCDPPLPEKEVQKIAHSGASYPPDPLASLPVESDPLTENTEQTEILKTLNKLKRLKKTEHERETLNIYQNGHSFTDPSGVENTGNSPVDWFEGPPDSPPSPTPLTPPYPPGLLEKDIDEETLPLGTARDKVVWPLVSKWLIYHKAERFDLDLICRQLDVKTRDDRQSVAKKLAYEVAHDKLDKSDRQYTYIDKVVTGIDWVNAPPSIVVPIVWPIGRGDEGDPSSFGFDGHVTISSGDVIVVAGVTNMGKSAFCLNVLWDNMDAMPCTLMGNEYVAGKFKNRIVPMTWADPLNENGTPKFELIRRLEGWKDIIRPDNLNIIDWINLEDKFWQMGTIIEGIQSKLKKGIALISIQKDAGKSLGLGGGFSQHLASLYLTLDFERLTVVKAKEWTVPNPNGKVYGFRIVEAGTKFADIRELQKCRRCWGTGKLKQGECDDCLGKGWVDCYKNY